MRTSGFAVVKVCAALALLLAAAAAAAPAFGDIRLVGSPSPRQGQLQVQVDGQWVDAVCQTNSTDYETSVAQVVCRQLGFTSGAELIFPKDTAGSPPAGNATVLTGALACTGSEARLADCQFSKAEGDDIPNCTDTGDSSYDAFFVGVVCDGAVKIDELRLAGGPSPSEGRVELRLANSSQWGTLCGSTDLRFGDDALLAQVVCRQLGYDPSQALARAGDIYGTGGLPAAAAAHSGCEGEEGTLEECKLKLRSGNDLCYGPAFGVSCNGSQAITSVRLVGGPSEKAGRLEVQLLGNDSWHSVCHGGWADAFAPAARLACRSLGFSGGATRGLSWYGTEQQAAIADLVCGPEAGDLNGCSFATAESQRCEPEDTVGVACEGYADIQELRLVNGTSEREGRVEIRLNGTEWWTVGSGYNPERAAKVVCRQLGYGGGAARNNAPFGGSPWSGDDEAAQAAARLRLKIGDLGCQGNETNLNECSWLGTGSRGYTDLLGVACEGAQTISAVRLTNNGTAGGAEGRLEVQIRGQWGTVCSFSDWAEVMDAAAAACRQLGFPGEARIVNGTTYTSDTSLPILIERVECAANQTSLNACSFDWEPSCEHTQDVGLVCTKGSS